MFQTWPAAGAHLQWELDFPPLMQNTRYATGGHSSILPFHSSSRLFSLLRITTLLKASSKLRNQRRLLYRTSLLFVRLATSILSYPSPSVLNGGFSCRWSKLSSESRLYAHHTYPKTSKKGKGTTLDFTCTRIQVA